MTREGPQNTRILYNSHVLKSVLNFCQQYTLLCNLLFDKFLYVLVLYFSRRHTTTLPPLTHV